MEGAGVGADENEETESSGDCSGREWERETDAVFAESNTEEFGEGKTGTEILAIGAGDGGI